MRTEADVRREIAHREASNERLQQEMVGFASGSLPWKAKMAEINTNVHVIAVLRWVVGEDLLWE
jgi:hypothetical protein